MHAKPFKRLIMKINFGELFVLLHGYFFFRNWVFCNPKPFPFCPFIFYFLFFLVAAVRRGGGGGSDVLGFNITVLPLLGFFFIPRRSSSTYFWLFLPLQISFPLPFPSPLPFPLPWLLLFLCPTDCTTLRHQSPHHQIRGFLCSSY